LNPGESKVLTFEISNNQLAFYRADGTFGVEPGDFTVYIGGNSRDTKSATFSMQ